jgi:hypothetical protein
MDELTEVPLSRAHDVAVLLATCQSFQPRALSRSSPIGNEAGEAFQASPTDGSHIRPGWSSSSYGVSPVTSLRFHRLHRWSVVAQLFASWAP